MNKTELTSEQESQLLEDAEIKAGMIRRNLEEQIGEQAGEVVDEHWDNEISDEQRDNAISFTDEAIRGLV